METPPPPYAAGILPYTFYNGTVYLLLGKDVRDNFWSDFGGKNEPADDGRPLNTAIREFYEETCGIIMDLKSLRNRMSNAACTLQSQTQIGKTYYMYTLEIPYNSTYRSIYRKFLAYMRHIKMFRKKCEKVDIKWVSVDLLLRGDSSINLRPVFKVTVSRWWEREGSTLVKYAKLVSDKSASDAEGAN